MKSQFPAWQPIETAPENKCILFYSPGNKNAGPIIARKPQWRVDIFNARWPKGMYQFPQAPYTHWIPLPEAPE